MATSYSEIALDANEVRQTLIDFGLDADYIDANYTTGELESLAFVSNIVLLYGIDNKSVEIEALLADYELETGRLEAMQETLNDLRDYVSTDSAKITDLFTFIEKQQTFIDSADMSQIEIDVTFSEGATDYYAYDTLDEYVTALENDDGITVGAFGIETTFPLGYFEYIRLQSEGLVETITGDGGSGEDSLDGYEQFKSGNYYLQLPADPEHADRHSYIDYEGFKQYLIASALQDAGYISEEIPLTLYNFVDIDNLPDYAPSYADYLAVMVQYYWGTVETEYDTSAGTFSLMLNGMAAVREAGVNFSEYANDNDVYSSGWDFPLEGETHTWWTHVLDFYAGDTYVSSGYTIPPYVIFYSWDSWKDKDIHDHPGSLEDPFSDSEIDLLIEAYATSIQSQSTQAEVALFSVNTAITEWGEFNDVWDLLHQYIHDARKRASDNSI